MSLQPPPDGFGDNDTLPELPLHYSSDLRKLVLRCYSKTQNDRPTAIDILDSCLQKGYWHQTLVGPYGTLISSDFDAAMQQSWRQCLQQLGLPIRSKKEAENPPALVDDVLAFTKLEQRDKYGEFALFIAGEQFPTLRRSLLSLTFHRSLLRWMARRQSDQVCSELEKPRARYNQEAAENRC